MEKKKDKVDSKIPKVIKDISTSIQTNLDRLYMSTKYSSPSVKNSLELTKNKLNQSITKIQINNLDNVGIPNMSKMYSKIMDDTSDKDIIKNIENIFDDKAMMDNILSSYMQNKYLKDLDVEIDVVCKYMPKLLEALDVRKDNVLSADHFSKDFITITNESSIVKDGTFGKRIDEIKEKYNLNEVIESAYERAAKYGEEFLYIVPYEKAITKLLQSKAQTQIATMNTEQFRIIEESGEVFTMDKPDSDIKRNVKLNIEIDKSGMISSLIENSVIARRKLSQIQESSLNGIHESKELSDKVFSKKGVMGDLDFTGFDKPYSDRDEMSKDGLLIRNDKDSKTKITTPGCILKRIDRTHIIPIYIEDLCLGYYYLEFKENDEFNSSMKLADPIMSMKPNAMATTLSNEDISKDRMLKYISSQLSKYIDKTFINSNQDLRKEIYMILKHNDLYNTPTSERIKVSFLPPEDVVHIYFKKDPKSNRGISDLERSLLPAKLYAGLYVTNTLAIMTRGQDKRVYYVKQNAETNIAKTLLNTITQIKKDNFNIRQIENINHVLNITGTFNDFVIPMGPSGDSPVQFEIMQGQNVEIKTELMNIFEEMAINSTDVPLELIQTRQSIDYATHYTMTNSKFLKKVYNRQAKYEIIISQIATKLYNGEYNTDDRLSLTLPPPMFLNVANTSQMFSNANSIISELVQMEYPQEENPNPDEVASFTRIIKRKYYGTFINIDEINDAKIKAAQDAAIKPPSQQQ